MENTEDPIYKYIGSYNFAKQYLRLYMRPLASVIDTEYIFAVLGDIAIVPVTEFIDGKNLHTFPVREDLLEKWSIDRDAFLSDALANTALHVPAALTVLCGDRNTALSDNKDKVTILAFSNICNKEGASAILYPGVLDKICEKLGTDMLFLLPSSIHEFIVCKHDQALVKDMCQTVRRINKTLPPDEFLSDNVYVYEYQGHISMVDSWNHT